MKKLSVLLISITFFIACKSEKKQVAEKEIVIKTEVISNDNYELIKPSKKPDAVLVLFGGYPESANDIKREFKIIDIAKENGIAVLFMNFNRKLWLEENEKVELATLLQNAMIENKLPTDNIYIGGFSSGGTVSLLISNFIVGMKQFYIDPKGVFIIDSPIDLLGLYNVTKRTIEKSTDTPFIQESTWLFETLEKRFGNPKDSISAFEEYAVYTSQTETIKNLGKLKNTKIRLYTEPDIDWWKENAKVDYEDMNAYFIKKLSEVLKKEYEEMKIEYIPTTNRGYRANRERHPHSWSIVDKKELVNWMLDKK